MTNINKTTFTPLVYHKFRYFGIFYVKKITYKRYLLKYLIGCAPFSRNILTSGTNRVSSNQAPSRHIRWFTYRCFLPDLTGFINSYCARPDSQRHFYKSDLTKMNLKKGIKSCYSGLQVQGTAAAPPSTAKTYITYC